MATRPRARVRLHNLARAEHASQLIYHTYAVRQPDVHASVVSICAACTHAHTHAPGVDDRDQRTLSAASIAACTCRSKNHVVQHDETAAPRSAEAWRTCAEFVSV